MAGRILNRRELRKQTDQAEQAAAPAAPRPGDPPSAKGRPPAATKVRRRRAKKAPPRLRARWGVFNASVKQVAVFDYNQRAAADEKLAELLAADKGLFYLQIVKAPMPEPVPPT